MTEHSSDKQAVIVIIGNEILNGRIQDSNSHYFCRKLHELGVRVNRIITIPDEPQEIAHEIKTLSRQYDFVLVAGGVGPTHDDVTMASIAQGLGKPLYADPYLDALIRKHLDDEHDLSWLKMALVPEGMELLGKDKMTFPVIKVENIYIFPGIPEILVTKFEGIQEEFRCTPYYRKEIEIRVDEARLVPILNSVVSKFPEIQVGSYPLSMEPDQRIRLSLESKDKGRVEEANIFLQSLLKMSGLI
ncbi:competence/damage-inducible protein A [bacterium]|nr:competence/damage-inducible protein A [bacterium]